MNQNLAQAVDILNDCKKWDECDEGMVSYNAMWFLIEYIQDLEYEIETLKKKLE